MTDQVVVAIDVGGDYRLPAEPDETKLPPIWQLLTEWLGRRGRPTLRQVLLRAGLVNSGRLTQQARTLSS